MTLTQLFPADLREDEATQLRRDLETYRAYLAGPCPEGCPNHDAGPWHREYTIWYEEHRTVIVTLNSILDGEFDRSFWTETTKTIDPSEL